MRELGAQQLDRQFRSHKILWWTLLMAIKLPVMLSKRSTMRSRKSNYKYLDWWRNIQTKIITNNYSREGPLFCFHRVILCCRARQQTQTPHKRCVGPPNLIIAEPHILLCCCWLLLWSCLAARNVSDRSVVCRWTPIRRVCLALEPKRVLLA